MIASTHKPRSAHKGNLDTSATRAKSVFLKKHGSENPTVLDKPGRGLSLASIASINEVIETCRRVVGELHQSSVVLQSHLHVESRASSKWTPQGFQERQEWAMLLRLIVQGRSSRIPVLWQATGAEAPLDQLRTDLSAIESEVDAAANGLPVSETFDSPVILSPFLAANLIHEIVGHSAEADNAKQYGNELGMDSEELVSSPELTVIDDPTLRGHRGSYAFDDDGNRSRATVVLKNGHWNDQLDVGHRRRVLHAQHTLPRMGVTFALPGSESPHDLISKVENGYYVGGCFGGGSIGAEYLVRPAYARRIVNGHLTSNALRRFDLRGHKKTALAALAGVGDDLTFFEPAFGCDKEGQDDLPMTYGAPHLRFSSLSLTPIKR